MPVMGGVGLGFGRAGFDLLKQRGWCLGRRCGFPVILRAKFCSIAPSQHPHLGQIQRGVLGWERFRLAQQMGVTG